MPTGVYERVFKWRWRERIEDEKHAKARKANAKWYQQKKQMLTNRTSGTTNCPKV